MFISKTVWSFLVAGSSAAAEMKEELSALRVENSLLKTDLAASRANFNWLATRVNALEVERALLLEKATGVKTTVPEIARSVAPRSIEQLLNSDLFEDMGEDKAKELGLPNYN